MHAYPIGHIYRHNSLVLGERVSRQIINTPEASNVVHAARALICSVWHQGKKEEQLKDARASFLKARQGRPPRVAVSGFNMSINAAGRAYALAEIYACSFDTTLIGFLHPRFGGELWAPLRSSPLPFQGIHIEHPTALPRETMQFVLDNPFDIVHLSKPRFSNVLLGILYQVIWGATVFMDVDDEDLGVLHERQEPLSLDEFMATYPKRGRRWRKLLADEGTRVGVGLWDIFDGVTVSNPALQKKYGGLILPHARSAALFHPSQERKTAVRHEFDIPLDATVFLFFGTARRHKGLLETAKALGQCKDANTVYVIAGDIPDDSLQQELMSVTGAQIRILPNQPYERVPDIVGMADACVLLQEEGSLLAQFQLPAKLIDALAMELMVFLSPTPAVQNIIDAGAALSVTPDTLVNEIEAFLSSLDHYADMRTKGRQLFLDYLSVEACTPLLLSFIAENTNANVPQSPARTDAASGLIKRLGGWSEFSKNRLLRYIR